MCSSSNDTRVSHGNTLASAGADCILSPVASLALAYIDPLKPMLRGNDADGSPAYSHAVRRTTACGVPWQMCTRGASHLWSMRAAGSHRYIHPGWMLSEPHDRSG